MRTISQSARRSDLSVIRSLHRADGGFIPFAAKPAGAWANLFSLPTAGVVDPPAETLDHLHLDAYFGINSMVRAGPSPSKAVPSLPQAFRRTAGVKYLNAAYTDLDVYKAGGDVERTIAEVTAMQDAGQILRASFVVRSGRGVWLLWLLKDGEAGVPPEANPDSLRVYSGLQKAIQRQLAHLGADPQATDAPRVMRVPGSVHSGTGKVVTFEEQCGSVGLPHEYTLHELATAFGATPRPARPSPPPRPPAPRPACPPVVSKVPLDKPLNKRGGWRNVFESRLRQLRKLESMRGGFSEGSRNHAALLLADTLIRLGRGLQDVQQQVFEFGANCDPPLSAKECQYAVRSAISGEYRFCNDTISNWLDIQPDEALELETWKVAVHLREQGDAAEKPNRRDLRVARRQAIRLLMYQHGGEVLPVRRLVELLKEGGHVVSHTTVWNDLRGMGLVEGPLATAQAPGPRNAA